MGFARGVGFFYVALPGAFGTVWRYQYPFAREDVVAAVGMLVEV